ncbi:hypothetical protein H8E50_13165 [bacterium]|nr:hypothetical protein [bacterium]
MTGPIVARNTNHTPFILIFFALIIVLMMAVQANADQVNLSWEPPTDSTGVAGYKVYYGLDTESYIYSVDVANSLEYAAIDLLSGVTYYFAIVAYASDGSESSYSNEVSYVAQVSDNIAPVISNVMVSDQSGSYAIVSWTTDEPSTSLIEYGGTESGGLTTVLDTSYTINHSQFVTISPGETFYYTVSSSDEAGNIAVSGSHSYEPPDNRIFEYFCDTDLDGSISSLLTGQCIGAGCEPVGCQIVSGLDCNDNNAGVFPDAPEVCDDQIDNDCDGLTDTLDGECFPQDYYCDSDSDGSFSTSSSGQCSGPDCAPEGCQLISGLDCDDINPGIYPGAAEICDGIDNNCNLVADEGDADGNGIQDCLDQDGDTFIVSVDNCPDISNPDQADYDGDGIGDACDNCIEVANPDQRDTNELDIDGFVQDDNPLEEGIQHYGNMCDGDFDNNGIVEIKDFILWRSFAGQVTDQTNEDMDMNGNGVIWMEDFIIWKDTYAKAPGPGVSE